MKNQLGVSQILNNDSVKKLVRYLGTFRVIEGDLGLFDKLARVRDMKSFVSVLNEALRVKDRVITKLIEGYKKEYDVPALSQEGASSIEDFVKRAIDVGENDVKEILTLAEKDPHFVATTISALSLAYSGVVPKKEGKR